jgi:selenocysteine lyase/cysteine desulfurase
MPQPVLERMRAHLALEEQLGGYEAQRRVEEELTQVYRLVERLLGAAQGEVALCTSGTAAWSQAVAAIPWQPGDKVLVTEAEYQGNLVALQHLLRGRSVEIVVVSHEEGGDLSLADLQRKLDARVKLVALVHVPSNNGLVNDVESAGAVLANHPAFFLVDACQSVGQMHVNLAGSRCDLLVGVGRKYLRGPRGTAFLCVRRHRIAELIPPVLDTWSASSDGGVPVPRADARRFETWERNVAAQLGLGTAIEYLLRVGPPLAAERIRRLAARLRGELSRLDSVVMRDLGRQRAGLTVFSVKGHRPEVVQARLSEQDIYLDICELSGTPLARLVPGVDQALRASVHYYNDEDDVVALCSALSVF